MAVQTLTVNGDGTTTSGFAAEGGTYTKLQSDDGDTTRLYTPTANDVRQVTVTDTSGLTGATINSVTVYAKYRSLDPVANTFQIGVRSGGTDYWSGNKDTVTSTAYILFSNTWTTDPATSAAWTTTNIDAVQAGIKKINAVGGACTYVYVEVDYTVSATYDTNTKLLLHMDGADASTTFTDSETTPKTITAAANAQIDTAQSKFGGASALFDGTGDYLSAADSADWDFTGVFFISLWYKANARVNYQTLIGTWLYNGGTILGWNLRIDFIDGTHQPLVFFGAGTSSSITGTSDINDGAWHYLEISRDSSNNARLFVDGTQEGSTTSITGTISAGGGGLLLANNFTDLEQASLNGWIDEVIVVNGTVGHTANYTSPTAAWADPASASTGSISMTTNTKFFGF